MVDGPCVKVKLVGTWQSFALVSAHATEKVVAEASCD